MSKTAIIPGKLLNACHKAVDQKSTISALIGLIPGHWFVLNQTLVLRGTTDYSGPPLLLQPESILGTWPKFPDEPIEVSETGFKWSDGNFPMVKAKQTGIIEVVAPMRHGEGIGYGNVKDIRRDIKIVDTVMDGGTYLQRINVCGEDFDGPKLTSIFPLVPPIFAVFRTNIPYLFCFAGRNVEIFICHIKPLENG